MPRTASDRRFFPRHPFSRTPPPGEERGRRRLMTLGLLFVLLGAVGLTLAFLVTLATTVAFGILCLVGGGAQTVHALSLPRSQERGGYLLVGVLYLVAGLLVILNPLTASALFTFFLAAALVVIGCCRIAYAVKNRRHKSWLWPLVAGNLSILLGIMILLQWPLAGVWALGLLLSLEMLFHGWGVVALPLLSRRAGPRG